MRTRTLLFSALLLTSAVGTASRAFAQDTSQMSEEERKNVARTLAEEGQKAFDAKNWARAEQAFRDAEKAYPAPTITLSLARTLAAQGKLLAAVETYNRIIREQGAKPNLPPPFQAALDSAKSEVGPMQNRLANLTLSIEPANAPNLHITLDDKPFPNAMLGVKRQIDPGAHTIKVSADGFKTADKPLNLGEGASSEMKVTLEPGQSTPIGPTEPTGPTQPTDPNANPPPVTPPPTDNGGGGNGMKYAAFGAFGLAGAGLVVGSITGLIAIGKASDLKSACTDGKCPPDQDSNISSYKTMGAISTVGFIVAGVGAAAGTVLFIMAPPSKSGSRWISPYVGAGSVGAGGRF